MEAFWSSFDISMSNEDCELMARLFYNEEEQQLQNPSFKPPLMSWSSAPLPPSPSLSPPPFFCNHYSSEDGSTTRAINGGFDYCANESDVMNHCLVGEKIFEQKASIGGIVPSISASEHLNPLEDETTSSCNGIGDHQILRPKRKLKNGGVSSESEKRARILTTKVTKRARNVASKIAQKRSCDEEDHINAMNCANSCSYSSEDDSKSLQDVNGVGSKRSDQEPSTNPQSLYARKRRERINERLRILQNLVPNGTKVDISTMLEEAVHYVKFLQLQIKLLSSDELWMYAPIAYNGVNVGLDVKISPPLE